MAVEMSVIHEKVCEYFKIGKIDLFDRSRALDVIYRRQIFHYLSRNLTNKNTTTFAAIGNHFGDVTKPFDHALVIHSCKKIKGYLTYDKQAIEDVEAIKKMIKES